MRQPAFGSIVLTLVLAATVPASRAQTCSDYTLQSHFASRATLPDSSVSIGLSVAAIEVVGPHVFATGFGLDYIDPYFQVFDFSDIRSPVPLGSLTRAVVGGNDVRISGDTAYVVASHRMLIAISISDPANPVEVGALTLPDGGFAVAIAGSTAFVADDDSGLVAVDVFNPTSPTRIGLLPLPRQTHRVVCNATHAFVGLRIQNVNNTVKVIDISDPANMAVVGTVSAPCVGMDISGSYLYTGGEGGLRVIDVSNPSAPVVVGSYTSSNVGGLDVRGGRVYAAFGGDSPFNTAAVPLAVFDVSSPTNPVLAMTTNVGVHGGSRAVCAADGYVYAADSGPFDDYGIEVLEIKEFAPTDRNPLAELTGNGTLRTFRVAGTRAFAGAFIGGATPVELRLFDLTTPTAPVLLGSAQYADAGEPIVAVDANASHAFVVRYSELLAVDITSPPALPTVGSLAVDLGSINDMRLVGSHVYVLDIYSFDGGGLRVFDVTNPSAMIQVDFVQFSEGVISGEFVVRDDYAYVAWGQNIGADGLEIVDVSNPANPTRVTTVPLDYGGNQVALDGEVAFVAYGWGDRLAVIDVSNPLAPVLLDDIGLPLFVTDLAVLGSFLYAGTDGRGVAVLDVSNPADVRHVGIFRPGTPQHSRHVEISGGFLLMSCTNCNSPFAGVYLPQCDPTSAVQPASPASSVRLSAHPNPFNPTVLVRLSLPDRQNMRVSVVDVAGRVVAELLEGRLEKGDHEVRWDGRDRHGAPAASGVYFVRAVSGNDVQSVKVTLLK